MVFDQDGTFDIDNGIELAKDGTKIFSGQGTPIGTQAPQRSYYFDNLTGLMWYKYGALTTEWREVRPEQQQDHTAIFTGNGVGQSFNKNTYERLAITHINGLSSCPPNCTVEFQIIVSQAGTSSIDIQLYDVTNAQVIAGPINVTSASPEYRSAMVTLPAGDTIVEIQGKKNGNSVGTLYWGGIEMRRDAL